MFKKAFILTSIVLVLVSSQALALVTAPSDVEFVGGFTKIWGGWTVNHTSAESDSMGVFQIVGTDTTLKAYATSDTSTWAFVDTLASGINYALTVGVLDTSGTWVYSALTDSVTTGIPETLQDDLVSGLHYMRIPTAESYTKAFTGIADASDNQVRYLFDMDSSTDSDSSTYFHPWDFTGFFPEIYNAVEDSFKVSVVIKGCFGNPGDASSPFTTVPIDTLTITSHDQQVNKLHMVDTTGAYTLYEWIMLEVLGDADCGVNQQFYIWIARSRSVIPERM